MALHNLGLNRYPAAVELLARAFQRHMDELLRARSAVVPYGVSFTPALLFNMACHVYSGPVKQHIKHLRPYLAGEIDPHAVNRSDFEAAARLIARLRMPVVLSKVKSL